MLLRVSGVRRVFLAEGRRKTEMLENRPLSVHAPLWRRFSDAELCRYREPILLR
jgi:hypothetical protein